MPPLPSGSSAWAWPWAIILFPRVINVDGNPSYPKVVKESEQERTLGGAVCVELVHT
jgi:hypothetical protein